MASVIEIIHKLLERPAQPTEGHAVAMDEQAIDRLLHLLCETRDDELSCEEVYGRLDEYVDCLASRRAFAGSTPLVEHHLALCPDCRDEYDALVNALLLTGLND